MLTGVKKRTHVSDDGYSNIANHTLNTNSVREVFGVHGPGKR